MKGLNHLLRKSARLVLRRIHFEKHYDPRVREDMKELVAPLRMEKELADYYEKRLVISITVILFGSITAILIAFLQGQSKQLIEENGKSMIIRNAADGVGKQVEMEVDYGEEKEDISFLVEPVQYTQNEFMNVCEEIEKELSLQIKGENKDLEHICNDLVLIGRYGNYPFVITWNCNDYTYIHTDGTLNLEALRELSEEGALAELQAVITYENFEKTIRFPIRFIKPVGEKDKTLRERLKIFLEEEQDRQKTENNFVLPRLFEGKEVYFSEKKSRVSIGLWILSVLTGIVLFFAGSEDLHKETLKRREQLLREYPELVSKLMLFMGAGMTMKSAFYQLYRDMEKRVNGEKNKKNYLYEELKYMIHSIENGISETEAYEQFGKRCRVNQYRKLMAIIIQSYKKGSGNLMEQLEAEVKDNFEQRKNDARRMGEKAGTKLLFPMILMLGIVMVVIMVPAFVSYGM